MRACPSSLSLSTVPLIVALFACGGDSGTEPEPTGPGTLSLTVSTGGVDPDRNGYLLTVDGAASGGVPSNGSTAIDLSPGVHRLELEGVQGNCEYVEASVEIETGQTTAATLTVTCSELPNVRGRIVFFDGNDIWAMNPDRSGAELLVDRADAGFTAAADITPDGKWIALTEYAGGGNAGDVIVLNFLGDRHPVAQTAHLEQEPTWLPDGRLAYLSDRDGTHDLFVVDPWGGAPPEKLLSDLHHPEWSRDGTRLVFVRSSDDTGSFDIYVAGPDGADPVRLTETDRNETEPHWSWDGSRIAFAADDRDDGDILYMNADGTGITRVTASDEWDGNPWWAPDDASILFSRRLQLEGWESFRVDTAGQNLVHLTEGLSGSGPLWIP